MIRWAEPNELATLLSQCAKQILALVEAAALVSLWKYEQMKDILLFLMQPEGIDKLQENDSLLLALGLFSKAGEKDDTILLAKCFSCFRMIH